MPSNDPCHSSSHRPFTISPLSHHHRLHDPRPLPQKNPPPCRRRSLSPTPRVIHRRRTVPNPPTSEETNGRLATVLNLPPPKLSKSTPITIPEKRFRPLLGTFRTEIPGELITAPTTTTRREKRLDVSKEISQLCTKIECPVSQSYFAKVLEPVLARHPRRESVDVIIAATFLILTTYKDGTQKKLSPPDKKKVIEAFDGRFQSKEVNEWMRVIEADLEETKWFERNPIKSGIVESRKRKSEGDIKNNKGKLAKNISGVGIMVCLVKMLRANVDATGGLIWSGKTG